MMPSCNPERDANGEREAIVIDLPERSRYGMEENKALAEQLAHAVRTQIKDEAISKQSVPRSKTSIKTNALFLSTILRYCIMNIFTVNTVGKVILKGSRGN